MTRDAKTLWERVKRLRTGRASHLLLPVAAVAYALEGDPSRLRSALGPLLAEEVLAVAERYGAEPRPVREERRLIRVGVNATTAAALAAHYRKAG